MKSLVASFKWLLVGLALSASSLYASEPTPNEQYASASNIFDLSLNELLALPVTVASKSKETQLDAPGVVTVYSAQDIQETGYYTLSELSDITAGYGTNTLHAEKGFQTRGQASSGFDNQRHLILINDIPVNHARSGKAMIDYQMPLYFAQNVEFLRGPASALYGVGAYYGVVSVTPKSESDEGSHASIKMRAGNQQDDRLIMANGFTQTETGEATLALSHFSKNASFDEVGENGNEGHLNWDDDNSNFFYANFDVIDDAAEGLSLGVIYMDRESGLGEFWNGGFSNQGNELYWKTFVPYLKYNRPFGDSFKLKSYLKANYSEEKASWINIPSAPPTPLPSAGSSVIPFAKYDLNFENYELEVEGYWDILSNLNLIFGVNFDMRKQTDFRNSYDDLFITVTDQDISTTINGSASNDTKDSSTVYTLSQFAQIDYDYNFLAGGKIVAGMRFDESSFDDESYSNNAPRIALIQKFRPDLAMKLLWGNALRAPSVKELTLNGLARKNVPASVNIREINPETIETLELNTTYQAKALLLSLTLFKNKTKDTIYRDFATAGAPYANRENKITAEGFEIEANYQMAASWYLWANYSSSKTDIGNDQEVTGILNGLFNTGIHWTYQENSHVALVYKHVDHITNNNDEFDGYDLFDLNFQWNITKALNAGLQLKNITDENYFIANGATPSVLGAERSHHVFIELKL